MAAGRWNRLRHHRLAIRATKSLLGSVVATVCSEAAFALSYGTNLLGTTGASAVAFVAGAVPGTTSPTGPGPGSAKGRVRVWARGGALHHRLPAELRRLGGQVSGPPCPRHYTSDHLIKTLLVSAADPATYAVLFGAKFAAYELAIFADPTRKPGPDRARHHVPTTSRRMYKRVVLKLSGEALAAGRGFGVDVTKIHEIAGEIAEVHKLGVEIAIVVGGGNFFRGVAEQAKHMDRLTGDNMGMLATVINALALQDALENPASPPG